MEEYAINILWITSLAIPGLVFLIANNFNRFSVTLFRAVLAVGAGWAVQFAYGIAAQHLSGEPINGAAIAFVSVFGWVLPTIIVGLCWLIHWFAVSRRT